MFNKLTLFARFIADNTNLSVVTLRDIIIKMISSFAELSGVSDKKPEFRKPHHA